MGGKSPSNFLLVIKMDAIYFFWHSNYIDICHQLFVLTRSVLSAAASPLHLTPLVQESGRDGAGGSAGWGASQVSSEPALLCPLTSPGGPEGQGCGAAFLCLSHSLTPNPAPFPNCPPRHMCSQTPLFSQHVHECNWGLRRGEPEVTTHGTWEAPRTAPADHPWNAETVQSTLWESLLQLSAPLESAAGLCAFPPGTWRECLQLGVRLQGCCSSSQFPVRCHLT